MDLLNVLNQRYQEQNYEVRKAKNQFWGCVLVIIGLVVLSATMAPVMHPGREQTFLGMLFRLMFLIGMGLVYCVMVGSIHLLTLVRSIYSGVVATRRGYAVLLPPDNPEYVRKEVSRGFYASFVLTFCCGSAFSSSSLFFLLLLVFCGCYVVHVVAYYS